MRFSISLYAVSVVILAGCAAGPDAEKAGAPANPVRAAYDASISDTAVYRDSNVRQLAPLAYPIQAVTLTGNTAWADGKEGQTVTVNSSYGMWITVEPEVRTICRTYAKDKVIEGLHYLLGLQPVKPGDEKARFVRFTIDSPQATGPTGQGVYRPCANPDPTAPSCGNQIKGPPAYVSWFANQMTYSYQVNPDLGKTGYPWTRLGYTYDWTPGSTDHRGAQEYIVPGGTKVRVTQIIAPEVYCAAVP